MNPVPVPEIATLHEADVWGFLSQTYAMESLEALALHVAQITVGMSDLKERLEALEGKRRK